MSHGYYIGTGLLGNPHLSGSGGTSGPVVSAVAYTSGGSGGQAPHPVMVQATLTGTSQTGGGWWPEGRWQVKFVKSTGSDLDAGDITAMTVTDPTPLAASTRTDQRYLSTPHAGFVFSSAGTFKVSMRYQNAAKEWSSWTDSSNVTVAANTRTKRYCNSTGDNTDGTTEAKAKTTLAGALGLVSGDNFEIELKDDDTVNSGSAVDLSARSGIWIHRKGGGTNPPKVVAQDDNILKLGNDSVVDGVEIEYATTRYSIISTGVSKSNIALMNMRFNEVTSFCELASDRLPTGWLFFKCVQLEKVDRYCVYSDTLTGFELLGCNFPYGSESEHVVRLNGSYIGVNYSTLNYANDATSKSAFRAYGQHVGARRSVFKYGTVHCGNIDLDSTQYRDYCFDCCVFDFNNNSTAQGIYVWNNVGRVVLRSSLLFKAAGTAATAFIQVEDNADGEVRDISGVRVLNCTARGPGDTSQGVFISSSLGDAHPLLDTEFRGILLAHTGAWGSSNRWTFSEPIGGVTITDCVLSDLGAVDELSVDGIGYTPTEANAEAWAAGLQAEDHTIEDDGTVLEGDGDEWLTAVASAGGVFEDLVSGSDWVVGPAGCTSETTPVATFPHTDDFNRSNRDLNLDTMSDGVGEWAHAVAGSSAAIDTNQAELDPGADTTLLYDSTMDAVDIQRASCVWRSSSACPCGPAVRINTASGGSAVFAHIQETTGTIFLIKRINGVNTIIGASTGAALSDGDTIEVRANGTNFKTLENGVEVHSVTASDSEIATGRFGLYASVTFSGVAPGVVDSFSGDIT